MAFMRLAMCSCRKLERPAVLADEKDYDITFDHTYSRKKVRRYYPPTPHASNGQAAILSSCHLAAK